MDVVDIVFSTTCASTSVGLPSGLPKIGYAATTSQYLQGADGLKAVQVRKYDSTNVWLNKTAVKYNVLKLKYRAVSELVRT